MDDREVARAIAAGDGTGLAVAFGEYAQGLYIYCRSQLAEPADAAEALRDTFVIASSKVAGLRDPACLRPWLFAVARNECHGRLPVGVASARDEAAGMADAVADPGAGDGQVDLRAVVRAALAALSPADGEIIELNLRHGLDGAGLADVLGVPAARVHALVSRARSRFGTSLAIVASRAGRGPCPALAAIAVGRGGALTARVCRRAERHIQGCLVCHRRLGQESPARLVFLVPAPILPAGLPPRIFRLTADAAPGAAAYRARIARGAEPFSASGFPSQLITPSVPRRRGSQPTAAVAAAVAVAALAVLGGGSYFVAYAAGHGEPPRAVATRAPAPEPTGPSRSSRALGPTPASSPAPAPAHTPSQSAPATPRSTTPALTAPIVTTLPPTTAPPTTAPPTTLPPTTAPPTTAPPTTAPPMTAPPTTAPPTTAPPTTLPPTTAPPTTAPPTTAPPTTPPTTTAAPATATASPTSSPSAG